MTTLATDFGPLPPMRLQRGSIRRCHLRTFSSGALPDEDVRAIVGYLDTLHAQPSSGIAFGGLGPVAEGLFAWIIGIGGICLIAVWIAAKGARAR